MIHWGSSKRERRKPWNGMIQKRRRLDPQVWGRTPLDIQRHILAFLPLPSLSRFKSVSKSWNSAISNGTLDFRFRKQRWYLMTRYYGVALLDGNAGSAWKAIDVPNLETAKDDKTILYRLVCSSTGLVACFDGTERVNAAVFNPLVQDSWLRLPQPPQVTRDGISEVVFFGIQTCDSENETKTSFIVVHLLGFSSSGEYYRLELQVYSSRVGVWTSTPVPAQALGNNGEVICICTGHHDCVILREDHLYFITAARDDTRSLKSMSLLNPCDVKTIATWTKLPLYMNQVGYHLITDSAFPGMGPYQCRLLHCAGKILLVGLLPLERKECSINLYEDERRCTVGILSLDEKEAERGWQVLTSLPLEILPKKKRKGMEMLEGRILAGASGDEVTLLVLLRSERWGGIYNATDGTWRSAFGKEGERGAFFPISPSLAKLAFPGT